MKGLAKIPGTDDAWDTRKLGEDEEFVKRASGVDETVIDASLELQPISIRLQKSLIEDFKLIAQLSGLGYQPLMRQVLARFADCEKKRILREVASSFAEQKSKDSESEDNQSLKTGTDG